MRCNKCGEKIVKYPWKDESGKIIWKNMFKMEWMSIALLIIVIFMTISYKSDTAACREVLEKPCTYAQEVGCYSEEKVKYSDGNSLRIDIKDGETEHIP